MKKAKSKKKAEIDVLDDLIGVKVESDKTSAAVVVGEPISEKKAGKKKKYANKRIEELSEKEESPLSADAHARRIAESRKALDVPVEPGQKLFEAPDGYIMPGDAKADRVWYRYGGAEGKSGCWINPRR